MFHLLLPDDFEPTRAIQGAPWWRQVYGADWRHPAGPQSSLDDLGDHPVVHVSWNDAAAYCAWAGVRLPTEAEWEYAARGGLVQQSFAWGAEFAPGGRTMCNIFEGDFPTNNTADDGYVATAPVDAFDPNGYGLFNVAGNVWEWCQDRFTTPRRSRRPRCRRNEGDPWWLVPVPRLVLQPLPGGGADVEHDRLHHRQHGVPGRQRRRQVVTGSVPGRGGQVRAGVRPDTAPTSSPSERHTVASIR